MLAAASLGAVHALEPGHGKTFITSYLLTGRSSRKQMVMGFSMAFSHTLILLAMGALLFFFSSQVAGYVSNFILIGSPLLVAGIGAYMVYQVHRKKKSSCSCSHHTHDHHHHGHVQGDISTRTAAVVGFTGGLLPCPSALAVFSLSGINGNPQNALAMMMLYVTGFVVIMGLLIIGASFINNRVVAGYFTENKSQRIQKISAYAILLTGVVYLIHNLHYHV
jgi:nickel/cobalt transporter (NicO) family protein